MLMENGANPCLVSKPRHEHGFEIGRDTPLHYLSGRNSDLNLGSVCRCALTLGRKTHPSFRLNMDAKNMSGKTALHLAISNRNANVVKQLLECRASPVIPLFLNSNSMKGYKPIHLACKIGDKQILSYILLSIFENCSNFQLNEKTILGEDPLDLILTNFQESTD